VLEALSAGIAVVANASGGTGELVVDGKSGWLLAEDCTAGDLARALAEAAQDPARCAVRGARGRARVRERHSLDAMALRYLSLLADGRDTPTNSFELPDARPELHPA
jgi:glycosyltransferase involved in cell wall biosynthesis